MTFDSSVPLADQVRRIIKVKTGRKHQHRIGPGKKRVRVSSINPKAKQRKRIAAYWRGELDEFPQ
jgi:hypothetical protein